MWIGCHADCATSTPGGSATTSQCDMTATSSTGPAHHTGDFWWATWAVGRRCRNEPSWRQNCSWTRAGTSARRRGPTACPPHYSPRRSALVPMCATRFPMRTNGGMAAVFPRGPRSRIPVAMRVAQLAEIAEVHHRAYGAGPDRGGSRRAPKSSTRTSSRCSPPPPTPVARQRRRVVHRRRAGTGSGQSAQRSRPGPTPARDG